MSDCEWIRIESTNARRQFVTSCGYITFWHRKYQYCPFCGKFIEIPKGETAWAKFQEKRQ